MALPCFPSGEFSLSHLWFPVQIASRMKTFGWVISALSIAVSALGADTNRPAIIPAPQKMEVSKGQFRLAPATRIQVDAASGITGEYLASQLRKSTGYPIPVSTNDESLKGVIELTTKGAKAELGPEGYELNVAPDAVSIKAPTQAGLFYGVQTLMQLFPSEILGTNADKNVSWEIPFAVHIEDRPRFQWRGFMLDCARHFFSKDDVKHVLDGMALHKLNTFHWHLTDDQGWRIEIKKYPKLTEVGAWRKESRITPPNDDDGHSEADHVHPAWDVAPPSAYDADGRYGGFYTQDDVREVVAYAASRHITVVPEIEMPGHAIAALAAYPELGCGGSNFTVNAAAGVNAGVFCVGDDKVLKFLDDVIGEVAQLFPSKYIHVGGDEVNAAVKSATWGKSPLCLERMKKEGITSLTDLQGWFTGQIGKSVTAHGKTLLGWTEIVEGKLPPNAVVMDWQGGAVQAATNGHDVVMSPTKFCYLDYYQATDVGAEPPGIGGFIPLDRVYSFEPIPNGLSAAFQSHILGGQGNLWTEYIPSVQHVDYMAYPRLCALAEVVWSPKAARNFEDFSRRLQVHESRLAELGINYRRDVAVKMGEWTPGQISSSGTNIEWDVTPQVKSPGQYRVNFQFTHGNGLVVKSVSLLEDGKEAAADNHTGFAARNPTKPVYVLDLANAKPDAKYTLRATVSGSGSSGTVTAVLIPKKR